MKDFLTQCLKDLEPLTGIRQLFYLESDQEDGKRKIEVLIKGMLVTSQEFSYIPEAAQKLIISSQMVQDQEYEALNSRVIWKWLNAFKGPYLNPKELQDKPVVFEPISPEVQKEVDEFLKRLGSDVGKPILKDTKIEAEMVKIEKEDKERVERKSLSGHYKANPDTIIMRELKRQYALEHTHLHTGKVKEGSPDFETWLNEE